MWPLNRWNPEQHKTSGKGFTQESDRIKAELKNFLDKENELSLIVNQIPEISFTSPNSLNQRYICLAIEIKIHNQQAKQTEKRKDK